MTITLEGAIPSAIRQDIAARLDAIEAGEGVRLLMAVESGSRAWGFPSPDSDYDVRFVYVRRRDAYLGLVPVRDVIETPIEDEIDLNGWGIRKALGLLLRSNAIIGEWMASPIRYRADDPAIDAMRALADDMLDARALAHHYANLGRAAAERWFDGDAPVPVKRYFDALRPALAIRCLRQNPGLRPPMNLQALLARCELPNGMAEGIAQLVVAKARTNEKSNVARLPDLDRLIMDELGRAAELPGRDHPDPDHARRADAIFLELVNR